MAPSRPAPAFTLRNERRDFPEWHLGRMHYALWALEVDTASVRQRVQAAQDHLGAYLLQGYCRQAHITLGLCGFLSPTPQHGDDFGPAALQVQLAALRQAKLQAFELAIGGLQSFSSVPYLTVQGPPNALQTLRQCLASGAINSPPGQYTPHVTVGLYAGVWPLSQLQAEFDRFADRAELELPVRGLSLMSYAASEIGGPLQTLARFDLKSATLHWSEDLPRDLQAFAAVG